VNSLEVSGIELAGLFFVIIFLALIMLFTFMDRKNRPSKLREITAFTKLKHQIGLAVEAGQRIHVSLRHGGIDGIQASSVFVGLSMLKRIARTASISDQPPVTTSGEALEAILSQDTMRGAYQQLGIENQYQHISGQVSGLSPFAYSAGTIPIICDQNVSTNLLSGSFGSEVALMIEAAERKGSLMVAGSDSLPAQAVIYSSTENPLIGEELFAGGAYLQAGGMHLASLKTQDVFRWILVFSILVGGILKLVGIL
jgi:hypothetical protein